MAGSRLVLCNQDSLIVLQSYLQVSEYSIAVPRGQFLFRGKVFFLSHSFTSGLKRSLTEENTRS